jgi:hypothetical protein
MISVALALALTLQDPPVPPPPIIHFVPPKDATIDVRADCWGRPVRYRIEARGGRVRMLSYTGSAGRASRAQLAQWNEWLAPMRRVNGHEFQCRGSNESLNIWGVRNEIDGAISVPVRWESGYMRLLPDPNTLIAERSPASD